MFRFESILKLRRYERDQAGQKVSEALSAIGKIDDQLAQMDAQYAAAVQHRQSLPIDRVDAQMNAGRYEIQLKVDLEALQKTREQLDQEVNRRMQWLRHAEAEVNKFDHLRDAHLAETQRLQRQREQAEADEFNSRARSSRMQGDAK